MGASKCLELPGRAAMPERHLNLTRSPVRHYSSAEIFNSKKQLNADSYLGKT